ncbi:MAG: glycosyltransferase family 2 protein [bacterium]
MSIIIPIYNEEKTSLTVIEKLIALETNFEKELIIVDDGSTDKSLEILKGINDSKVTLITHESNRGKGSAIRTAIPYAKGRVVAIQDADLEYSPEELMGLIEYVLFGDYDIVFGSRFMKENPCIYRRYLLGNKIMSFIVTCVTLQRITDSYTCYKVFRKDIISTFPLFSKGFEIEAELSVYAALCKARFREMPISYNPRRLKEGKKIKWVDMLKGVYMIIKTRVKLFYKR